MGDLRSFKQGTDVQVGSLVWWKDGTGHMPPLRLGRVLAVDHTYLVVQVGPDRFDDTICAPYWKFYEVEMLPHEEHARSFGATVTDAGGGVVALLVDRDTHSYPEDHSHVIVTMDPGNAWCGCCDRVMPLGHEPIHVGASEAPNEGGEA